MTVRFGFFAAILALVAASAAAQDRPGFVAGPVFADYGRIAPVAPDMPVPPDTMFRVAFDVSDAAEPGKVSRALDSAARFINMNVAAGVPEENVHVAIVVHGPAGADLTSDAAFRKRNKGASNGSAKLVAALIGHGVDIYLCGQSAAAMGIAKDDLLPGVKMALSAMTAHALLQQRGYTVNPF